MTAQFVPVLREGQLYDYAWVDEEDFERVSAYKWIWLGGYAGAGARQVAGVPSISGVPMHRFILGLDPSEGICHHINEDRLDNRRSNLQVVASLKEHGDLPHPRRDAVCSPYTSASDLPPHERELALRGDLTYSGSHHREIAKLILLALAHTEAPNPLRTAA